MENEAKWIARWLVFAFILSVGMIFLNSSVDSTNARQEILVKLPGRYTFVNMDRIHETIRESDYFKIHGAKLLDQVLEDVDAFFQVAYKTTGSEVYFVYTWTSVYANGKKILFWGEKIIHPTVDARMLGLDIWLSFFDEKQGKVTFIKRILWMRTLATVALLSCGIFVLMFILKRDWLD